MRDQVIFDPNYYDLNIFIIGSGNIAYHLTKALKKNNVGLAGVYSRNKKEGQAIARMSKSAWHQKLKNIPTDADIYLVCVSDDAIQSIIESMPKSVRKSKIIAHTSGSKSMSETLNSCKNGGVFYPLQTFTKGNKMTYRSIPFCINGKNKKTINKLLKLAAAISDTVHQIDDNQRKNIHLSAVIINNFVNHLIMVSEDLLKSQDIDADILQPLLQETIKKQKMLGAFEAQTGPARRLDAKTLAAHLDLLKQNNEYSEIYKSISKSIQKTYKPKV